MPVSSVPADADPSPLLPQLQAKPSALYACSPVRRPRCCCYVSLQLGQLIRNEYTASKETIYTVGLGNPIVIQCNPDVILGNLT